MSDENNNETPDDDAADAVADAGRAAAGAAGLAQGIAEGDAAGAAQGVAGAASGALGLAGQSAGGEAGEVADAVGQGVQAAGAVVGAAQSLSRGDAGGALQSATGAAGAALGAAGGALGEQAGEARAAIGTAAEVGRALGSAVEVVQGAEADALVDAARVFGAGQDVSYALSIDGTDAHWDVLGVAIADGVGEIPVCTLEVMCPSGTLEDGRETFGHSAALTLDRGEAQRSFRGVVRHCQAADGDPVQRVRFEIVPALWMLDHSVDSRIYQNVTVPDLVTQVVDELLGSMSREVRDELSETYPVHEYLVQHRESHLDFLSRLLDEEGIWFFFDHEGEHEVLVLCDSNENRPAITSPEDGRIEYTTLSDATSNSEVAVAVDAQHHLGATDVVVSGFDWSNPSVSVRHEALGRGEHQGAAMEIHAHHHSVRHHEYDEGGGQYQSHSAERNGRMHSERLDLARSRWTIDTTVLAACPGHTIELVNSGDHDGQYLVLDSQIRASWGEGDQLSANLRNQLDVIPLETPYRPPAPPPRMMPGPETAIVVGPAGEEIHVDQHGRVKVQFHWDRRGERNEHSSAWIRVAQMWSGPGWGSMFIPRINTEVIVSFLGGDPERPVITGCLYNGDHRVPYALPDEKTKSTIKTNSSPGGGGYNELRFEDKAGSEEIFTHAQKDYNEVVEHCHSTHVKVDQSNTVDNDQTETVGHDQTMTVRNDRTKTVENDETTHVQNDRTETVDGEENITLKKSRYTDITEHEKLFVHGNRRMEIDGRDDEQISSGRVVEVKEFDALKVLGGANRNVHVTGQFNTKIDDHYVVEQGGTEKVYLNGHIYISSDSKIELMAPGCKLKMEDGKIELDANSEITLTSGGASVAVKSDGTVELVGSTKVGADGGGSTLQLTADGVKSQGNMFEATANAVMTLTGTLIKLN